MYGPRVSIAAPQCRAYSARAFARDFRRQAGRQSIVAERLHGRQRQFCGGLVPIAGIFLGTSAGAGMMWQPIPAASITHRRLVAF